MSHSQIRGQMEVLIETDGFYCKFGVDMSSKTAFWFFICNEYLKFNHAIFKKKEKMSGFYLYTLYRVCFQVKVVD